MTAYLEVVDGKVLCFYCNGHGTTKKRRPCLVCGNSSTPGRMSEDLLGPFIRKPVPAIYLDGRHRK